MLLPRQNNPMKFSVSPGELVKQLLVGSGDEYLAARDAVREVNRDLLNHQEALLEAMSSAFFEFADRFDPDELQQEFDDSLEGTKVLGFLKKSKYWDLYCDLYPVLTDKGSSRLPQMFSEEFMRAYAERIDQSKSRSPEGAADQNPHEDGQLATVRYDK